MTALLRSFTIALITITTAFYASSQDKKAMGVTDMMKFRLVKSATISEDGNWVLHTAVPDRGDSELLIYSSDGKKKYSIPRGEKPVISSDGRWVAAVHTLPAEEILHQQEKGGKPETGLILFNTSTGDKTTYDSVRSFSFSNDSKWLFYHSSSRQGEREKEKSEAEEGEKTGSINRGSALNVRSLDGAVNLVYPHVTKYAVDSISKMVAYAVADTGGTGNTVFIKDLSDPPSLSTPVYSDSGAWSDYLCWNNRTGDLAFLAGSYGGGDKREKATLFLWSAGESRAVAVLDDKDLESNSKLTGQWVIYPTNRLRWSKDGERLFVGIKPESEIIRPDREECDSLPKLFDTEAILSDRQVDVWHWNDPYINPHQKKRWKREKDRTYTGVYYPVKKEFIPLATTNMPELRVSESASMLLGYSNIPYAKQVTWSGRIYDYYLVNAETGEKRLAIREQEHRVSLSPDGKFLVYYSAGEWYLMDAVTLKTRNLTGNLRVSFADEDWDYPEDAPGYGTAEWLDGSEAVIIYDKYDIWQFPVSGGEPRCLTEGKGREEKLQFRIWRSDPKQPFLKSGSTLYLTAYHDMKKHTAIYSMTAGTGDLSCIVEEPKKYTLIAKARNADKILFSRESYTEFPDLWITGLKFNRPLKLSDVNPQVADFAWGKAELVEWSSIDGTPLQGILIKPGNYQPGKRYPVLVYYYRFYSNRLYSFNQVAVNHRPCFPFYASNGYALFLPDIRFDIGNPGYSATKCLVPGVQKIIDMGIADPNAICLHGHSWSGYQTAFVITQTDIFTCAIAGAPVSNMTSAYSGIRWETGLARQFQYEKSQSRIGGSLWEARDKYIENSPLFFADRINTPLLIQFGDMDGAVPWYQGIELYLAMRRLEKECVFLQYRGEPHHLKKYANKLDYTLKFKAYLDHYLKGEPPGEWIRSGIPYQGK